MGMFTAPAVRVATSPEHWECGCCGASDVSASPELLPVGWRPWIVPDLGVQEDVLCSVCFREAAAGCDLERTGELEGRNPWV